MYKKELNPATELEVFCPCRFSWATFHPIKSFITITHSPTLPPTVINNLDDYTPGDGNTGYSVGHFNVDFPDTPFISEDDDGERWELVEVLDNEQHKMINKLKECDPNHYYNSEYR